MSSKKFVLIVISVAIISRFIGLDLAPPHLSNDEIGAAYNAYSISQTLKDSSNQFLPLMWKSHGGYGSPLAIYIPIASLLILGNNDFAVRIPSAVLGSLTIILIGLLVYEITKKENLALSSSLMLAISPLHFSVSRMALESNYALFFIVLGIYLFFVGLKRNLPWATIFSFISFAFSIYSYYSEWIVTPLIIISLAVLYRREILKKRVYYFAFSLFIILLIPLWLNFMHDFRSSRANSEFITNDVAVGRVLSKQTQSMDKGRIIATAILDKYFAYNRLDYLFFYGANILPKENPYQFGFLLAPFVVAFFSGLYKLKKHYRVDSKFVYLLLVVSPVAGAVTEGELNNWRSLPQLLPLALITASGSIFIWESIKGNFWARTIVSCILAVSVGYFLMVYFRYFPLQKAVGYQYGYKQISWYIKDHDDEYRKIVVDQRFGDRFYYYVGVPSSYIPFYTEIDPAVVQHARYLPNGIAFDKYEFRNIDWAAEKIEKDYLYVVPAEIIPGAQLNLKVVSEILLPSKIPAFKLYSWNN